MLIGRTMGYPHYVASRYGYLGIDIVPLARADMSLLPLLFFFDSTHVARTSWYREFVFGDHVTSRGAFRLRRGEFIEDKLGQAELNDIKQHGMAAHAKYGTFLLDDGGGAVLPASRRCARERGARRLTGSLAVVSRRSRAAGPLRRGRDGGEDRKNTERRRGVKRGVLAEA